MADHPDPDYVAARVTIGRLVLGYMSSQVIGTAARLRIADHIGAGERDAADLAAAVGVPEARLIRLLRAMAASELLVEPAPGRFRLTLAGSLLRTDRADSVDTFARMFTDPAMTAGWQRLADSLRTGRTAFDDVFGTDFFSYLAERPELFNDSMSAGTRGIGGRLPDVVDLARFRAVADVGGGDGTLLAELLARSPGVRGILVDTAERAAQAPGVLAAAGVADRCTIEVADFFRAVPAGADLYLLKSILHDWDDDRAATILRHCRAVVPSGGGLLIIEPVLPETVPTEGLPTSYLSDLNMLVNVGGRERTRAEFDTLLGLAGFTLTGVDALFPAPHPMCAIPAVPA